MHHNTIPSSLEDLCAHAPVFVLNLERQPERYEVSESRIAAAGFRNVQRYDAIDGNRPEEWRKHPAIRFDPALIVQHAAGCMLTHLAVWNKIVQERIPVAVVFEDDVIFHKHWQTLAPLYLQNTPPECDIVYMGHHCGNAIPDVHISRVPVYCTNAYIITERGAHRLYQLITEYPYKETHALDMMLVRLQNEMLRGIRRFPWSLEWFVWNTEMFPDEDAQKLIHPHLIPKDKGLVFQQNYQKIVATNTNTNEAVSPAATTAATHAATTAPPST